MDQPICLPLIFRSVRSICSSTFIICIDYKQLIDHVLGDHTIFVHFKFQMKCARKKETTEKQVRNNGIVWFFSFYWFVVRSYSKNQNKTKTHKIYNKTKKIPTHTDTGSSNRKLTTNSAKIALSYYICWCISCNFCLVFMNFCLFCFMKENIIWKGSLWVVHPTLFICLVVWTHHFQISE